MTDLVQSSEAVTVVQVTCLDGCVLEYVVYDGDSLREGRAAARAHARKHGHGVCLDVVRISFITPVEVTHD